MAVDLIVKNGTIVTPLSSLRGHILIKDGKLLDVLAEDALPETRETIDATGLHVLPGLVDPHVHFRVRSTILPLFAYNQVGASATQVGVLLSLLAVINMAVLYPTGGSPTASAGNSRSCPGSH